MTPKKKEGGEAPQKDTEMSSSSNPNRINDSEINKSNQNQVLEAQKSISDEFALGEAYEHPKGWDSYNGTLFKSRKDAEEKIAIWAYNYGLTSFDNFNKFMKESETGIYTKLSREKRRNFFEQISRNVENAPIESIEAEVVSYTHPLIADYLKSLDTQGFVYKKMSINEDWTRLVVSNPITKAIYYQTLRIQKDEEAQSEELNVANDDIIIAAAFSNVTIYEQTIPGIPDLPRKVEFDVLSDSLRSPLHVGPSIDKDAISKLEQHGLILSSNRSMDCFRSIVLAYLESGNAHVSFDAGLPGFYLDTINHKIIVSGYALKKVSKQELKSGLEALNNVAKRLPQARFGSFTKWSLLAPFFYILKQKGIYPRHFLMIGPTGTQKTALSKISHAIWGLFDISSDDKGFFISGSRVDSPYRLGSKVGLGTFPVIIDEPKGLFEKPALVEMLKTITQNLIARETADGIYPALSPIIITTNVSLDNNEDILASRFGIHRSTQKEQIRATLRQKEEFQKFQAETYPLLEFIGQYVAAKLVENPDILTAEYKDLGIRLLEEMYAFAEMEIPEFVYAEAEIDTVEDINESTVEQIRNFLFKANLDAYSRNIGRSYDDSNPMGGRLERSIKEGLLPFQLYKDTKGLEQVILTTGFAKEVSKIVGESYNLQSIGDLLGFEAKYTRVGNKTPWTVVATLDEYLKFLLPDVEEVQQDNAREIRGTLRKFQNEEMREPKESIAESEQNQAKNDLKIEEEGHENETFKASPITEREGKLIINRLLNEGFIVNPQFSGASLDRHFYSIAVTRFSDSERLRALSIEMKELGFMLIESKSSGPIIFTRPLNTVNSKEKQSAESETDDETVLQFLEKCTYNTTAKYRTPAKLQEFYPEVSAKQFLESLDRLVAKGTVVKRGTSYGLKKLLEETR